MPNNGAIGFYVKGMHMMPRVVKNHLIQCDGKPDECLVCALIKRKIEQ